MNTELIRRQALRFLFFVLVQVLVLKQIILGDDILKYVHLFLYPMFVFLLPIRTQSAIVVTLSFLMGTTIDIFYNSLGLHTAALVFSGFGRQFVLGLLEPHRGYGTDETPTLRYQNINWYFTYISIMLFAHLLFYFSVEYFTYVAFFDIIFNTIFSFVFSAIIIALYQILY